MLNSASDSRALFCMDKYYLVCPIPRRSTNFLQWIHFYTLYYKSNFFQLVISLFPEALDVMTNTTAALIFYCHFFFDRTSRLAGFSVPRPGIEPRSRW